MSATPFPRRTPVADVAPQRPTWLSLLEGASHVVRAAREGGLVDLARWIAPRTRAPSIAFATGLVTGVSAGLLLAPMRGRATVRGIARWLGFDDVRPASGHIEPAAREVFRSDGARADGLHEGRPV